MISSRPTSERSNYRRRRCRPLAAVVSGQPPRRQQSPFPIWRTWRHRPRPVQTAEPRATPSPQSNDSQPRVFQDEASRAFLWEFFPFVSFTLRTTFYRKNGESAIVSCSWRFIATDDLGRLQIADGPRNRQRANVGASSCKLPQVTSLTVAK